ncbi:MAG TPA: flagellar motor protein MotB [Terriglobales bacterium]|nr:flagellar motor protein MotB [Terriglobales bacterium]
MENARPIVIIKKKGGHGVHHGGAWKVAYADFVTAMMALFIVLWLLNTSKPVREAIAGYFRDPAGTAGKLGTSAEGPGTKFVPTPVPTEDMGKLKDEIEKSLRQLPNFDKLKNQIEIKVTPEGLRIELLESATGTFFDLGNAAPNSNGKELLDLLAGELGRLPNKISIEGHTDSKPFSGRRNYGNWELSTDRANAARRLMQQNGLGGKQVAQVRGFADQLLRKPDSPYDPSNRRISLIVQYTTKEDIGQGKTASAVKQVTGASPEQAGRDSSEEAPKK